MSWIHTSYPQQLRFGQGAAKRLRPLLKEAGSRRTLVITSPSVQADEVISGLGRSVVSVFRDAQPHVPVPAVRAAVQAARTENVDTIVSIGGGSVIDLAKAVLFFLEQEAGTPGTIFADRPLLTHVAVPTSLAGAEASARFAMTDPAARHKQEAFSPTLVPRWVVYDTELVMQTPRKLLAASGMTAISHALSAVLAPGGPEPAALGTSTLGRLFGSLDALAAEAIKADPGSPRSDVVDAEQLTSALEAAAVAARAAANSAPDLASALALLLGGRCGVDHGVSLGLLAPPVLRFNMDALGARGEQATAASGEDDLADALDRLRQRCSLPEGLAQLGVQSDDIAAVARLVQQHPAFKSNPRPIGEADVVSLLESAF